MPEPTIPTAAAATIVATAATIPALHAVPSVVPSIVIMGVAVGLRADVLLAGFAGSVVALAFFNTVPSLGDTWRALVETTFKRMAWCLASSLTAGYITPLLLLLDGDKLRIPIPESLMLSVAFVAGAGAQKLLARFINKADKRAAALAGDGDAV
jgi:hypothetical protein